MLKKFLVQRLGYIKIPLGHQFAYPNKKITKTRLRFIKSILTTLSFANFSSKPELS